MGGENAKEIKEVADNKTDIKTGEHIQIDTDGKITFKFKNFRDKYEKSSKCIENFKNMLALDNPLDIVALLFKLKASQNLVKSDNLSEKIKEFITQSKTNLSSFYDLFKQIFNSSKQMYSINQEYIVKFLNGENESLEPIEQFKKNNQILGNIEISANSFSNFSYELKIIDEFLSEISLNEQLTMNNYESLNSFFNENKEKLQTNFYFERFEEFKNFLNLLNQLKMFFNSKIELIGKFNLASRVVIELFRDVIQGLSSVSDNFEIMSELNEYFHVMIKHRYIRHVEIKIQNFEKVIEENHIFQKEE